MTRKYSFYAVLTLSLATLTNIHGMGKSPFPALSYAQQNTKNKTLKTQVEKIVVEKLGQIFYHSIDNLNTIGVSTEGNHVVVQYQLLECPEDSVEGIQLKVKAVNIITKQILTVCANHKTTPLHINFEEVDSKTISFTPVFSISSSATSKDEITDSSDESDDDVDNYIKNPIKALILNSKNDIIQ